MRDCSRRACCAVYMHVQLEALKATTETKEVTFKIAYGLPLDEMLRWGLFVSEPRNIRETDQPFPEPGACLHFPLWLQKRDRAGCSP